MQTTVRVITDENRSAMNTFGTVFFVSLPAIASKLYNLMPTNNERKKKVTTAKIHELRSRSSSDTFVDCSCTMARIRPAALTRIDSPIAPLATAAYTVGFSPHICLQILPHMI